MGSTPMRSPSFRTEKPASPSCDSMAKAASRMALRSRPRRPRGRGLVRAVFLDNFYTVANKFSTVAILAHGPLSRLRRPEIGRFLRARFTTAFEHRAAGRGFGRAAE